MYGMSRFAEKLNVQICENSMGNCVHFMYGISGFAEKLNIPNFENSTENCIIYVWNVCICKKIECPELRKFNGKLCTLYVQNV